KLPGGTEVWVADFDGSSVHRISTSTHSVTGDAIDLSPNSSPTDIAITQVKNPTATYAYVAGASGVSVVNTATGEVLDMGSDPAKDHEPIPTSAEPFLVEASSKEDGNVYVDFITGQVGIITANPLVAIASIAYSGGGSSLGVGGTMDVEFLVDEDSTYEFRSGGDIYGSGALLVDSAGSTSGSVIADEPTTATIPFDANKDAFDEGENDLWVFATSDGLRGRIAAAVSVDTPPPDVVVRSTGFGSSRVYVNFDRVDVSDMASYNVYVDTDPDAVLTKADAQASVSQPSGGSSVTGEVGGLSNGTLYYMAVEAVDEAGNTSDTRTAAFPDGSRVTAMPEKTVGPAGSEGCGLVGGGMCGGVGMIALAAGLFALVALGVRRARATMLALLAAASFLFAPTGAAAQLPAIQESPATPGVGVLEARSPNAWGFEAKTGFWMPSSSSLDRYFGTCCNLITRLEGSYLIDRKYGLEFGAGFLYKSGKARGEESGQVSQDSFTFLMFPLQASFAWRADYFSWRYLIPYAKAGFDSVIYRESVAGDSVAGVKWGMHVVGGTMLNISEMTKTWGDTDVWVDEFFMTFEAAYQYVSSFGSGKLDLSGPVFSVGLLFYF
ncbi:MAG: hypothetical protein JXA24_00035, partial [Proteobacteria bacterium]|nr:hypothetical protein [Pseudomonadota bacterium]